MAKEESSDPLEPTRTLRERAEEMLRTTRADLARMTPEDVQSLVHELQVQHMELQIQYEALRQSQRELAASRDRLSDLYEFAPVGYLSLDHGGVIQQANLRACQLLAVARQDLVGTKFAELVPSEALGEWFLFWQGVAPGEAPHVCELPLRIRDGQSFWGRMECAVCPAGRSGQSGAASAPREDHGCHLTLSDVSEERAAEQALRESEHRFRIMADEVPHIIGVHDAEGKLEFVNRSYLEFFGVDEDDACGDHWKSCVHPDDVRKYSREFLACIHERRPFHAEIRVQAADGQWRWLESWGNPYVSHQGEFLGFVSTSSDISVRKRAEYEIRRLNDTLEHQVEKRTSALLMLIDIASMASRMTDVDEAMRYTVRRVSEHNGWRFGHAWLPLEESPDELVLGSDWYGEAALAWDPPTLEAFRQAARQVRIRRGEAIVGEVYASGEPVLRADVSAALPSPLSSFLDRLKLRAVAAFPILANGEVVGVLEFFSDSPFEETGELLESMASVGVLLGRVVERERSAKVLRESEEQLRVIHDAAPDAIITFDAQGVIRRVNPATETVFGYSEEELVGNNVSMLMPSPYREEHEGYLERYRKSGQPHVIGIGRELVGRRRDGATIPLGLAINEVKHLGIFIGIVRDISRRKGLEKQVVDAATEEQRRIGQDIHDGVGQELTGLRYMAQTHAEALAEQASPEAATAARITQWAETVQQQLRAIIRELVPVELDQQGLLAALEGLANRIREAHNLDCRVKNSGAIYVADPSVATQLYRIAQEAVANAVRHADAQKITIRLELDHQILRLQVEDDGVGTGSLAANSTGFGLRTMAYRAGLIGAQLTVSEGRRRGTVVTCKLPWTVAKDASTAEQ